MTIKWMGDQIKGVVRAAAVEGLREGVELARKASVKIAPLDTGELRACAYTDVDESSLIGIVGYDVPRDIKAIKQHEDLSYSHQSGEKPKFLEEPVRREGAAAQAKLAARLRRAFS